MMIIRLAFYGYAKTPEHVNRRCVELETQWDRGKVEWQLHVPDMLATTKDSHNDIVQGNHVRISH